MLQGSLPKKVLESIEDLVTDANFDCSSSEFSLQAMDSSHVALLCSDLRPQRLDAMGFNLNNMSVRASGPKAAPSPSFSKAPTRASYGHRNERTCILNICSEICELIHQSKALFEIVTISLSSELPVVAKYKIANMGYIRFYLAPKIKYVEV